MPFQLCSASLEDLDEASVRVFIADSLSGLT